MSKEITQLPNKVLRLVAKEVPASSIPSSRIQSLISRMKATLKATPDGVGLAAPQVGESLRIFIVSEEAEEIDRAGRPRRDEKGEIVKKPYEPREWNYYVFINPVIKNTSRKKFEDTEGCLSVPGKYGAVKRHEKLTLAYRDEAGKKITRGFSKFFSRVIQHECDHLEGILFIDKAEKVFSVRKDQNTP
ncbi:MAG: peptide deformylase [Candidatus Sungbacteria bacterium]|nr:peptide deformylase [Candidatus Sungbacteria bacterium]